MTTRPYTFSTPWILLNGDELVTCEGIGGFASAYLCTTTEGACILRETASGWFAALIGNGDHNRGGNLRYFWSTSYRHGHRNLTFAEAKDLGEAALVAASLFGINRVGSYEGGCVP